MKTNYTLPIKKDLLDSYLDRCDRCYDVEWAMLAEASHGPGYHSRIPKGDRVHPTRESLQYALGLLYARGEGNLRRAEAIIRKILALQDTDPFSGTYGIWPWYADEPLDKMDPPDWNWADFLGAKLAQILHDHTEALSLHLVAGMQAALAHAAWCIFRRNVRLDYTNIAVMGGGVAAVAGEMLDEPCLLSFGRERLGRIVQLARYHGSFTEYNSPTYTMVALEECERILYLARDGEVRRSAEELRQIAWQVIAEHFHPATGQWTGPQSRAYSDYISSGMAHYLSAQTGVHVEPHPVAARSAQAEIPTLIPALPCPGAWQNRFLELPEETCEIRRRFIRREDPDAKPPERFSSDALVVRGEKRKPRHSYGDRIGTTWFSQTSTLGSINHEDTWNQRRGVLGYWKTDGEPAACLRLRFLHEGKDFASGFVRNQQAGPRVLSAVTMLTDRGDWHPVFDHPADDVFHAEDFRLRYELTGAGACVRQLAADQFALAAGAHRGVVHTAPGKFGVFDIRWEAGQENGYAFVDAVCYHGPKKGFNLETMGAVVLAAGLELLEAGGMPLDEAVQITPADGTGYRASWSGLSQVVPAKPDVYPA